MNICAVTIDNCLLYPFASFVLCKISVLVLGFIVGMHFRKQMSTDVHRCLIFRLFHFFGFLLVVMHLFKEVDFDVFLQLSVHSNKMLVILGFY
jgi:hypothetical protein